MSIAEQLAEVERIAMTIRERERAMRAAVTALRSAGATWREVGAALGVTASAAQQRFGR